MHRDACFALTAWYLVGSPGVLPQSDTEAFLWAMKAAEAELPKAMYAVGYFLEVGIGTTKSWDEANLWYQRAADLGDKRAAQRLLGPSDKPLPHNGAPGSVLRRDGSGEGEGPTAPGGKAKDKDCVIM
jgi:TPR repeat protein